MEALYIGIIYIVFLGFVVTMDFYINLFTNKDQFSKEELTGIFPHLTATLGLIQAKYSTPIFLLFFALATFFGVLLPLISTHWFLNSAILFVIVFFVFSFIKDHIDRIMVTASESFRDVVANVFSRHCEIFTLGFGVGTGASLIYVWGNNREMSFLWFLANMVIATIMIEFTLRTILKDTSTAPISG
ncbi:MAG TPA: hypothetical protein PKM65_05990 [Spirochaetota bacterium]|nr:hypothetical protein [Spirochaetota bacterium]HNT10093.1 hypothetical protein [Spirochaetota bacterium]HNV47241.1 hypothetical protein [Spirochaetota bacterium]HOS38826.1 hypothetical protein [Spirochaetota bacterium]HPU86910.1 hypothetical protein [Spirochaetota bacterium]